MPIKVLTVVGARPQFVKAGVVSRALAAEGIEEILVHTGQHYDAAMSDVFFEELQIPSPAHHLGIGSGLHGSQTGRMLEAIESVLLETKPDRLLVYGDTNSTLAGALAASKLHIPIDHVEAGLRSFNRTMPEEINRIVTDHVASLLFAPTETSVTNLLHEGINGEQVIRSGDVMYDATLAAAEMAERTSTALEDLAIKPKEFILATIHRADNTDDPKLLRTIFDGLAEAANTLPVVLPLHPRTRASLEREGLLERAIEKFTLTEPKGYMDMTHLEASASLIATDSGGVQKEAFFHQVPCVTLRSETEWVELVDLGWNTVCNPASDPIPETILAQIGTRGEQASPYGDGNASSKIAAAIVSRHVAIN
jgi:UDP-GlcNAc3NAcA epimerase